MPESLLQHEIARNRLMCIVFFFFALLFCLRKASRRRQLPGSYPVPDGGLAKPQPTGRSRS